MSKAKFLALSQFWFSILLSETIINSISKAKNLDKTPPPLPSLYLMHHQVYSILEPKYLLNASAYPHHFCH